LCALESSIVDAWWEGMSDLAARAAEWLGRLIRIPSVAPEQAGPSSGVPGEAALAGQVARWFRAFGGEVHTEEVKPGRPNVYGIWRGRTSTWAGVDIHSDTVGVEQMTGAPFSGEVRDGRVWGRGAVDTKASLGIILALLELIQTSGQTARPNLFVAVTADEEVGATGARVCARWMKRRSLRVHQMMIAEPTECVPVRGHKGVARFELTVHGKAAHTSQPDRGQNAVQGAAHIVLALHAEHRRLQTVEPGELGTGALTVTTIAGGRGSNIVPDHCSLTVDRRLIEGEQPEEVVERLHQLAAEQTDLRVTCRPTLAVPAFLQAADSPWLAEVAGYARAEPVLAPYGTNAWAYAGVADETVVLGPGSVAQAHGAEEWVALSELAKMADIYARWWKIQP
jgi:acetylornithine deacetylase/succinyl-diaminopimelate desuccinylase-like protein